MMSEQKKSNTEQFVESINKLRVKSAGLNLQYNEFMEAIENVIKNVSALLQEKDVEINELKSQKEKPEKSEKKK